MEGDGGFVEIALELESGLAYELLIFGSAADWGPVLAQIQSSRRAEIEVKKCIGPGQQAGGFGRSVLAQLDGEGYRRGDDHDREDDGEGAPNSHGMQ